MNSQIVRRMDRDVRIEQWFRRSSLSHLCLAAHRLPSGGVIFNPSPAGSSSRVSPSSRASSPRTEQPRLTACMRTASRCATRPLGREPFRIPSSRHNRRGGPISHWASAQLRVRRHLEACRKERWWFHGPSRCSVHLGALFSPVKKPFSTVRRGEYVTDAHKV